MAQRTNCMRGTRLAPSPVHLRLRGLGSSAGYFSTIHMAGFQAPVQCWPDFLLAAPPQVTHTRYSPLGRLRGMAAHGG